MFRLDLWGAEKNEIISYIIYFDLIVFIHPAYSRSFSLPNLPNFMLSFFLKKKRQNQKGFLSTLKKTWSSFCSGQLFLATRPIMVATFIKPLPSRLRDLCGRGWQTDCKSQSWRWLQGNIVFQTQQDWCACEPTETDSMHRTAQVQTTQNPSDNKDKWTQSH